jgi:hypothetical protein
MINARRIMAASSRQQQLELRQYNHDVTEFKVHALDTANLKTILIMFTKESWTQALETTGKYPLFSGAAGFSLGKAYLSYKQAALELAKGNKDADSFLWKARVEAASGAVITVAVVTGFFVKVPIVGAVGAAAPTIFTCVLGVNTGYQLCQTVKYTYRACNSKTPEEKAYNQTMARGNLIGTVITGALSTSIGFVMLGKKSMFALLGIGGTTIGLVMSTIKRCTIKRPKAEYQQLPDAPKPQIKVVVKKGTAPKTKATATSTKPKAKASQKVRGTDAQLKQSLLSKDARQKPSDATPRSSEAVIVEMPRPKAAVTAQPQQPQSQLTSSNQFQPAGVATNSTPFVEQPFRVPGLYNSGSDSD